MDENSTFMVELGHHLLTQGKEYPLHPSINGKVIDLSELYTKVISKGGYKKISKYEMWDEFAYDLFQESSATLSHAVQTLYAKYLKNFEKANFFGEDDSRNSESRFRAYQESRSYMNGSGSPSKRMPYLHSMAKKHRRPYCNLEKSLLSCLPNEVDFAINACTLMSAQGSTVIKLPDNSRILDLLLLHIGIVSDDVDSLRSISKLWILSTGHNFEKFWRDTVQHDKLLKMVFSSKHQDTANSDSSKDEPNSNYEYQKQLLFRPKRAAGVKEFEGQRVLQIAMVLLNFSFEHFNVSLAARNKSLINLVLLLINSNYSTLKPTGLDILSNISLYMNLGKLGEEVNTILYETLVDCISSQDKFKIVRGMDILSKLVRSGDVDLLSSDLDDCIFATPLQYLVLPDIELIVTSLELLYRLSAHQQYCDHIAFLHNAIDTIFTMLTLNVREFNQKTITKVRLARKVVNNPSNKHTPLPQHRRPAPPSSSLLPGQHPSYMQQRHLHTPSHLISRPPPPNYTTTPHKRSQLPQAYTPILQQRMPQRYIPTPPRPLPPMRVNSNARINHANPVANPPTVTLSKPPQPFTSKPQGVTPTYTQSEMRKGNPPIFHYIPAPPSNIPVDKNPKSFAKLCSDNQKSPIKPKEVVSVKQRQEPLPVPGFSVKTEDDMNNNKLKRPHEKDIPSTEVVNKKLKCEGTAGEGTKINGLTNGNHEEEIKENTTTTAEELKKKRKEKQENNKTENGLLTPTSDKKIINGANSDKLDINVTQNNKNAESDVLISQAQHQPIKQNNGINKLHEDKLVNEKSNFTTNIMKSPLPSADNRAEVPPIIQVRFAHPKTNSPNPKQFPPPTTIPMKFTPQKFPPPRMQYQPRPNKIPHLVQRPPIKYSLHTKPQHFHQQQQKPTIDLMAPHASYHVLLRNCGPPQFESPYDTLEDPLTKNIRLTSTLILTNIAKNSAYGKCMMQKHKSKVVQLAMSRMDSSPYLAKLLYELELESQ